MLGESLESLLRQKFSAAAKCVILGRDHRGDNTWLNRMQGSYWQPLPFLPILECSAQKLAFNMQHVSLRSSFKHAIVDICTIVSSDLL